jgi:hypothetical protein
LSGSGILSWRRFAGILQVSRTKLRHSPGIRFPKTPDKAGRSGGHSGEARHESVLSEKSSFFFKNLLHNS